MKTKIVIVVDSDVSGELMRACEQLGAVLSHGRCQEVALAITEWDSAEHILSVLAMEGKARVAHRFAPALADTLATSLSGPAELTGECRLLEVP